MDNPFVGVPQNSSGEAESWVSRTRQSLVDKGSCRQFLPEIRGVPEPSLAASSRVSGDSRVSNPSAVCSTALQTGRVAICQS